MKSYSVWFTFEWRQWAETGTRGLWSVLTGWIEAFKDFSECLFDIADRMRAVSWLRTQVRMAIRAAVQIAVSIHDTFAEAWQKTLVRNPQLAYAIVAVRRRFARIFAGTGKFLHSKPWMSGALASAGLLALIFFIESLFGHPSGMHALYILPIWLATRLAGPFVGFGGVLIVSALLANFDERVGTGPALLHPNGLFRLGALTVLTLFISQVEYRLYAAQKQARLDSLTGVLNRYEIEKRIGSAVQSWKARGGVVTLAVVDCDRFKEVNDTHGHSFGDHVLRVLARRLQSVAKNHGLVGRLGGDEFVVLYENLNPEDAQERMKAAAHGFRKYLAGMGFATSISFGVASLDERTASVNRLIEAADQNMYALKRSTRAELH